MKPILRVVSRTILVVELEQRVSKERTGVTAQRQNRMTRVDGNRTEVHNRCISLFHHSSRTHVIASILPFPPLRGKSRQLINPTLSVDICASICEVY